MRVLIADDVSSTRLGLRLLLELSMDVEIVGDVTNARDLVLQVESRCPDLVLLAWELRGAAGTNLLKVLREVCPEVSVFVLSTQASVRHAALRAGADAFLDKASAPEQLLAVILSHERIARAQASELVGVWME